MPRWDEQQYLKFADERTRPAQELLARVPLASPREVVDLGCGPGNSTALLRARWPDAHLVGVDSSREMLAHARAELPDVTFIEADVRVYCPDEPPDVLFANAVLQWLPSHESLLPQLVELLRDGGVLALQLPDNFDEPSHRLMRELPGPWQAHFARLEGRFAVAPPAFYYDLLAPHVRRLDIWRTTYEHVLPSAEAIVEWVAGTGLRPYLAALPEAITRAYRAAYTAAIAGAYPARADGKRLFSFPRLFVVAER